MKLLCYLWTVVQNLIIFSKEFKTLYECDINRPTQNNITITGRPNAYHLGELQTLNVSYN